MYQQNQAYMEWLGVSLNEFLNDHATGRQLDKLKDRSIYDGFIYDMHRKYDSHYEEYLTGAGLTVKQLDGLYHWDQQKELLPTYQEDDRDDLDVNQLYPIAD